MQSRFALIIGVADYSAFDRSVGNPTGTSDLFGPAQNVAAVLDLCLSLGYAATELGVLSSPLLAPAVGRPALYATATRATVLEGVRTLAERLAAGSESQGLLWFSGHGDFVEGVGPVLCVEDTRRVDGHLREVVPLAEIAAILAAVAPNHAVTLVIDSCGSGTPRATESHTLGRMRAVGRLRDGDTLLSATAPQQTGVELRVDGAWRGAFTWALCSAIAQYARTFAGGFLLPDLTNHAVLTLAHRLLQGLSCDQTPQLRGHPGAAFLQPTGVPPVPVAFRLADGRRGGIEIYGDETGQITGNEPMWMTSLIKVNGASVGQFVSSYNTPSNVITPYKDYWYWSGTPWPSTFQIAWSSNGTASQNAVPTPLGASVGMVAFPKNLVQGNFGNSTPAGSDVVWKITSTGGTVLGYLVTNANHTSVAWLITWAGYQAGQYLANLPAPGGTGGVMMKGATLTFTQIATGTLSSVHGGYSV